MERAIQLCCALGLLALMCGASEARSVELDKAQDTPNFICDACLDFSFEAQIILSNPDTQRQAVDLVTQTVCQSLTPKLKTKCLDLVSVYVLDVFTALQRYLGPEFCTERGLCIPESVRHIDLRGKLLDQIEWATAELMKRLDDISPELSSRGLQRNDCALCQFVVLELKLKLRDPLTQERILEVLLDGCNRVQNHVDECKMIVTQYAPFILANLDNILDADALCSRIGACKTQKLNAAGPFLVMAHEERSHGHVYAL